MSRRSVLNAKESLTELSRPGPSGVRRGDLALVGLPGVVLTPLTGQNRPAIAFGHGWLQPTWRYLSLFRHLASWGFVVAAPATQLGPFASHRLFAADLSAALTTCTTVELGDGGLSVDPNRLAVGGHSTGGGAAVLAAAVDSRVRAVVTLAAIETSPSAVAAASSCAMPSLHVSAGNDVVAPAPGNVEAIAKAWRGPTQLRTLSKADHLGFTDGRHWSEIFLHGKGAEATRQVTRALVTAFLLRELCGEQRYNELLDCDIRQATTDYRKSANATSAMPG